MNRLFPKKKIVWNKKIRKEQAYIKSKPTFAEGAKTTATAATIEGTMTLCMAIAEKKKDGRKLPGYYK